uniref:non-specific serine/threonine protein kinase n=1 Tax=Leersia perrieri TaxID=77586 RepID=A0A0D9WB11_9ORYZ
MPPPHLGSYPLEEAIAAATAAAALLRSGTTPRRSAVALLLRRARAIHARLVVSSTPSAPPTPTTFLANQLLSLYTRLSAVPDAVALLRSTPRPSVVSYNTVLSALSRSPRHAHAAFGLFRRLLMCEPGLRPTAPSLCAVLRAAGETRDRRSGGAAHAQAEVMGFLASDIVPTVLLQMYSRCGAPRDANQVFDEMATRDEVAWNCVIHCNVRYGYLDRALGQFCRMVRGGLPPTESTLSSVLSGCGRAGDCRRGRALHGWVVKSEEVDPDMPLQNALLDMYSSCGDLDTALRVFDRIETPDLVSWNTLIAGFPGVGDGWSAMDAFVQLKAVQFDERVVPDEYTLAAVVSASAALPAIFGGKPLHAEVIKTGLDRSVFVGNTLLNMYFTNEEPGSARNLFDSLTHKDVIMWTEMVAGHSSLGEGELALKYFVNMLQEGYKVDSFSLSSALNSTAELAGLKQGEMLHAQVVKSGYEENICASGSLVDMYAKNGALPGAYLVFCNVQKPDLKCWNSIIGGYGNHGNSEMAFKLFGEMIRDGLQPDHVTYISLLSACSHCGLVEKGKFYWFCMMTDGIVPGFKHYTSMVSLLSRAGLLEEAVDIMIQSPFAKKCPELWRILLSSCITFRNLTIGVHAAEQALEQDPDDISTHILLSNLYASFGKWDVVAEIRKRMRGLMVEKEPGLSWFEMKNVVHVFSADDECHSQIVDCRDELLRLKGNMGLLDSCENELMSKVYTADTPSSSCQPNLKFEISSSSKLSTLTVFKRASSELPTIFFWLQEMSFLSLFCRCHPQKAGSYCHSILFLLVFVGLLHVHGGHSQTCDSEELAALLAFSDGLDRMGAGLVGWGPDEASCCSWTGISCALGRVVQLDLSNRSLSRYSLRGEALEHLGRLGSLRILDLSANGLVGAFPATDGGFLAIEVMNISFNRFTRSHPAFPRASNLTILDITSNVFSSGIKATALCSSPVKVLRFSANAFSGDMPTGFSQCKVLNELSLNGNGLTGSLPKDLYTIPGLRRLKLQGNQLSGSLDEALGNLSELMQIDLSYNMFTGIIPDVFGKLRSLEFLNLASNKLNGTLPLSLSRCPMLRVVSLRNNSLSGEIDIDFRFLRRLNIFDAGTNKLRGAVPPRLASCTELMTLNLARNKLQGELPESFKSLRSLSYLSLTGNGFTNLSSALQVLQNLPNLTSLVLTNNFRGGETMPVGAIEGFKNMQVLALANCALSGTVPPWLQSLKNLNVLDISWNNLHGNIPPWLGNLDKLFYIDMSNNSLSGELPESFTRMKSLNSTGDLPLFIKNSASTGKGLQYNQLSSFPSSLILSNNKLVGPVLRGFGHLMNLHVLDLGFNKFSGPIPDELSDMKSLEILDLAHNDLSGTIPSSLTKLSFLSKFDVSYNNLSGDIPTEGQFSTFTNEVFVGNPALYGIGNKSCNVPVIPVEVSYDSDSAFMLLTVEAGFAFGLLTIWNILFFARSWRAAYFQMVDSFFDKLYVITMVNLNRLGRKWEYKDYP